MVKNFGFTPSEVLRKITCGIAAILVLSATYLFVPPPRHAAAFVDQSTWAGTAAGTANAVILNLANVSSLNDIVGVPIRFNPSANSTGPVTVVIQNALGSTTATALQRPSSIGLVALSLNELWAGETTSVTYNGSVFVLSSNVDMSPIGQPVEFRGASAPRGALIEDGSCVSQTQFAALFSVIGTTYGSCSAGLFKLPFSNGTAFVAFDAQGANGAANRITTASCATPNSPVECGSQIATLTPNLIPNITSIGANSISVNAGGLLFPVTSGSISFSATGAGGSNSVPFETGGSSWTGSSSLSNSAQNISVASNNTGGTSVSHPVQNPMLPGIRAIKF